MFSNKKKFFIIAANLMLLLMVNSSLGKAQSITDNAFSTAITKIILNADSQTLALFFNAKVDMTLLNKSAIYSQQQAELVLSNFFKKNKPVSFNIINENKNTDNNYIIGKLHTIDKQFRVCVLTKIKDNKNIIYQLRIEE